jgi:hypothetical protein
MPRLQFLHGFLEPRLRALSVSTELGDNDTEQLASARPLRRGCGGDLNGAVLAEGNQVTVSRRERLINDEVVALQDSIGSQVSVRYAHDNSVAACGRYEPF